MEGYDAALYGWIEGLETTEKAHYAEILARLGKVSGGSSSSSSSYSGPFAVKDASTTDGAIVSVASGRITLGTVSINGTSNTLPITETCYVYCKITYVDSSYYIEIATASSTPAQTQTEYYIELAKVTFESGSISAISQLHYGNIEGAGRIF